MKRILPLEYAVIMFFYLMLLPVDLMAGGKKEPVSALKPTPNTISNTTQAQPVSPSNPFYTGDGGRGKSLAILAPSGTGLAKNQEYLPALVQGELVSVFSGYSAISVLDREHLDEQYAELFSGYYDENSQANGDLGHLTPTDSIMGGNITRTATGYALQIRIIRSGDKMTEASYSGTCTFAELDNLSAIRRASLELLQKIGVALTGRAINELSGAVAANHVQAQTAQARGITAARDGATVEALSYYYQAVSFEPALRVVDDRLNTLATQVTGGMSAGVKNDIQARRDWLNLMKECAVFMRDHPPFELVYDTDLELDGTIDYAKETASFITHIALVPEDSGFRVLNDLLTGLGRTGRRGVWGFDGWPFFPLNPADPEALIWGGKQSFTVTGTVVLVNTEGKTLGRAQFSLTTGETGFSTGAGAVTVPQTVAQPLRFANINANDLTDPLTVNILDVNGKSAVAASEAGYMRLAANTTGLAKREWNKVTEEEITLLETNERLLYSLSNSRTAIEQAITVRTNDKVNLNNVTWSLNTGISVSVKNLMNKHNVNYSMTTYIVESMYRLSTSGKETHGIFLDLIRNTIQCSC
jgi:hypothetical protein